VQLIFRQLIFCSQKNYITKINSRFDILYLEKDSFFVKKILLGRYRYILLGILIFVIGMTLGSFVFQLFVKSNKANNPKIVTNKGPLPTIIEEVRPTSADAELINIVLMGNGGEGHSGGGLMDAIILVSVNKTDKKAAVVSVPRDLWFSGHKINGDPSIKDAVAGVTGLSVGNYASIDFNKFIKLIDSLDGVEVDVKKAYTDNFYPVRGLENELCGKSPQEVADLHAKYSGFELEKQFSCRYEKIEYGSGINHMDGQSALKYVRSRHGGSDFERSRHQFEVLKAIMQKANIKSLASAFNFVKTDLNLEVATKIMDEIGNPLEYSVSYLGLSEENVLAASKSSQGAYILIPKAGANNYSAIKEYIKASL
jgi:anionic cell wall polymer biosynthesis LytR-Cps2A-Psr (LCP) family protein